MSEELILSANDSDLGILQRAPKVSSGTTNTPVDRGPMRPGVTDPMSLVKTMRSMAASLKELHDESVETKKSFKHQIQKLKREITTLKRTDGTQPAPTPLPSSQDSPSENQQQMYLLTWQMKRRITLLTLGWKSL